MWLVVSQTAVALQWCEWTLCPDSRFIGCVEYKGYVTPEQNAAYFIHCIEKDISCKYECSPFPDSEVSDGKDTTER